MAVKKKESPKERREREAAERQSKFKQQENARKDEIAKRKAEERAKAEEAELQKWNSNSAAVAKEHGDDVNPKKKTNAKAAGLKSVFIRPNRELLMNGFGRGNTAVLEKHVDSQRVVWDLNMDKPLFSVQPKDKGRYCVSGRGLEALVDDPLAFDTEARMDLIGCKDVLEQRYFGRTFEDNIHIQLIYNILDMEKLLAVHVNNMIYAIDNVTNADAYSDVENDDFIGSLGLQRPFSEYKNEKFDAFLKCRRLSYFGSAFFNTGYDVKAKAGKAVQKSPEDIYYSLCLLGALRQALAHGGEQKNNSPYLLEKTQDKLFSDKEKTVRGAARDLLDRTYAGRINTFNENFLKNAKVDLTILCKALDADTAEKQLAVLRAYYEFIVLKSQKNMGFSLKRVREIILKGPGKPYTEKDYDSVRSKMYKCFDFMAYDWYLKHEDEQKQIVNDLRAAKDVLTKEKIYAAAAKRLWDAIGARFVQQIVPMMNGKTIKGISDSAQSILPKKLPSDISINDDAHTFSKLMYLLTLFLDGKEINTLLTTLINKFENVQSYLDVISDEQSGMENVPFAENYAIFSESGEIARELRVILSFARMEKPLPAAKRQLFVDAARILGDEGTDEELTEFWDDFLVDPKDENAIKIEVHGKKKVEHGPRNFIASNVIGSDRFRYLVRYLSPEKASRLSKFRSLVDFTLKEIPDAQIVRYINACKGTSINAIAPGMRDELAEIIQNINFSEYKCIRQYDTSESATDIQKATVSLYLTVLYLMVKNLINVNTRYFIAFFCWERDSELLSARLDFPKEKLKNKFDQYTVFADCWIRYREEEIRNRIAALEGTDRVRALEHMKRNAQRSLYYIKDNYANADAWAIREFRNQAEHLTAIRHADSYLDGLKKVESWFAVYHYLLQKRLLEEWQNGGRQTKREKKNIEKVEEYGGKIEKCGTYCKDFVKALCISFCYNLPRYKNLCIDGLFDQNRPGDKKEQKKQVHS